MNIRMSRLEKAISEKNATTPATVKAVEEVCVTCGSNHNGSKLSIYLYSNPNTDPNRMPLTKAKGQIPQKDKIHKIESMIKRFRKRYSRVVCPNEAAIEGLIQCRRYEPSVGSSDRAADICKEDHCIFPKHDTMSRLSLV
ncbi:hypothetical protein Tco_1360696 [Tanacetum coccineum]